MPPKINKTTNNTVPESSAATAPTSVPGDVDGVNLTNTPVTQNGNTPTRQIRIRRRDVEETSSEEEVEEGQIGQKQRKRGRIEYAAMPTAIQPLKLNEKGLLSLKNIKAFEAQLKSFSGFYIQRNDHIPSDAWYQIKILMGLTDPEKVAKFINLDDNVFFAALYEKIPDNTKTRTSQIELALNKTFIRWKQTDLDPVLMFNKEVRDIFVQHGIDIEEDVTVDESKHYIKILENKIFRGNGMGEIIGTLVKKATKNATLFQWTVKLVEIAKDTIEKCLFAVDLGAKFVCMEEVVSYTIILTVIIRIKIFVKSLNYWAMQHCLIKRNSAQLMAKEPCLNGKDQPYP